MMKPSHRFFSLGLVLLLTLPWGASGNGAGLEWNFADETQLEGRPVDVATSSDGEWVFILMKGEIQAFSSAEGRVTARIPVDPSYDRLAHSSKGNELILASSTGGKLQVVRLDAVHRIDISGLPFKGLENAPVTIAVFSDYQ